MTRSPRRAKRLTSTLIAAWIDSTSRWNRNCALSPNFHFGIAPLWRLLHPQRAIRTTPRERKVLLLRPSMSCLARKLLWATCSRGFAAGKTHSFTIGTPFGRSQVARASRCTATRRTRRHQPCSQRSSRCKMWRWPWAPPCSSRGPTCSRRCSVVITT